MKPKSFVSHLSATLLVIALLGLLPNLAWAHDPEYSSEFDRARCTFATTGNHPYFPLIPGYTLLYEGEEEDDGELIEIALTITVLPETERIDGVLTRVLEERETEEGELVEVSRNFMAVCRETGDVWYFGEDVDDYEDGEIVDHDGAWRAGVDGARAGILIPGNPLIGARHFQEVAPGVALDRAEVLSLSASLDVPFGSFQNVMRVGEDSALEADALSEKWYAKGLGLIKDDELELVDLILPDCRPDAFSHCLNNGRFEVRATWKDFDGNEGQGVAILASGESGEFWFFSPGNTELVVKVLDACNLPGFGTFWVFAGGLTNVEVTLTVTDTQSSESKVYVNPLRRDFEPILDTQAFATCP